jgi:hypothetical protein
MIGAVVGDFNALHTLFAEPTGYGATPEQTEKLKSWLTKGMAFGSVEKVKKGKKAE